MSTATRYTAGQSHSRKSANAIALTTITLHEFPMYDQVMDLRRLIQENRSQIMGITGKYGASNVCIIGSVTRGEASENSDIDFLVSFEPGRTLLDHAGLIIDLEKLLERKIDVASDGEIKERYKDEILHDAVEL